MGEYWFAKETSQILRDIKKNNSKQWYIDNKEVFQEKVVDPLVKMVCRLSGTMLDIDGQMEVRPHIGKTISRIQCDARFSKGILFKDRMWVTFRKHGVNKVDYPSYFFEISPYYYRYGMGFFSASPSSMAAIREQIDREKNVFLKIIDGIEKDDLFSVEGQLYKKDYYKGSNSKIASWYNRKNIYIVHNSQDLTEIFSIDKIEEIRKKFIKLKDMYYFWVRAISCK